MAAARGREPGGVRGDRYRKHSSPVGDDGSCALERHTPRTGCAADRHRAGPPLPAASQGSTGQARSRFREGSKSDFRARLLLAPACKLYDRTPAEIAAGILASKTRWQQSTRPATPAHVDPRRLEDIGRARVRTEVDRSRAAENRCISGQGHQNGRVRQARDSWIICTSAKQAAQR